MTSSGRSILAGLVGQGVTPSLTPQLHEREAQRQGLRYVYRSIDLPDERLSTMVMACSRNPRFAKRSAIRSPALQFTSDECAGT